MTTPDPFAAPARRKPGRESWGSFSANYPGRCAACGEDYEAGESIRYSREDSGYIARCCTDE